MKNNETKKLNNKGFSLVELIIVIAIMAVLVGVLAPQYLKYVEKSRESADLDNYRAIISAVQVYYTDPANTLTADDYTITFGTDGKVTATTAPGIETALNDAGITTDGLTMKSKAYKTATLTLTVTAAGEYKLKTSVDALNEALGLNVP